MSGIVDHTYAHGQKFDVVWVGMGGVHDNIHIPNCGLWFLIGYYWVGFGMIGSYICQHDVCVLLTFMTSCLVSKCRCKDSQHHNQNCSWLLHVSTKNNRNMMCKTHRTILFPFCNSRKPLSMATDGPGVGCIFIPRNKPASVVWMITSTKSLDAQTPHHRFWHVFVK